MNKMLVVIAVLFSVNMSFAAFTVTAPAEKPAMETKAEKEKAVMEMVVRMSVKDYEALTGTKMNFAQRLAYKITKKRFAKKLEMAAGESSSGFNTGGFALGFFLGLIGVLIAYVFFKDKNLRKWSWIGLGAAPVIVLLAILLYANNKLG